jgi:hypothetical protein
MNRFFKTNAENYEAIRAKMDREAGYPSGEADTWFAPVNKAPKDSDGNILIASMPEISNEFILSGANEITEQEYNNLTTK